MVVVSLPESNCRCLGTHVDDQPFTLYPIWASVSRTRERCFPWISIESFFRVPPAPHTFFNFVNKPSRSFSSGDNPQMTVTIFPFLRFSSPRWAVWLDGSTNVGFAGGLGEQRQSASSCPHRSHLGGISNGVPSNSRMRFDYQRKEWGSVVYLCGTSTTLSRVSDHPNGHVVI